MRFTSSTAIVLSALFSALAWSCDDDETTSAAASTTGTPASSTAAGMGGSGPSGSGGASSSSSTGGSVMMMPCNADTCDLTFEGSGFGDHDGKTLYWGIQVQGQQPGTLVYQDEVVIAGGAFSFTAPGILEKGTSYNLNYYIDTDGMMDCDINMEPIWRQQLPNIQTHLHVTVTYDVDNLSNLGCSGFN